jgi:hypothetical protein
VERGTAPPGWEGRPGPQITTAAFREHGEDWAIEPRTEYAPWAAGRSDQNAEKAYRNDAKRETTLMCPGAEGWRTFWKQQVDRAIRDYDFDGIYFDFWYEQMVCENTRHGCGGHFRKATVLGAREMLMYAYTRLKAEIRMPSSRQTRTC